MVDVTSPQVAAGALGAEVTSVVLPVAEGSTTEVAEEVTSITEPLEIEWYGAGGGGGGGGPWGGGGAAPFGPDRGGGGGAPFPGRGGSAEAEARPKPSTMVASVETIFLMNDGFFSSDD